MVRVVLKSLSLSLSLQLYMYTALLPPGRGLVRLCWCVWRGKREKSRESEIRTHTRTHAAADADRDRMLQVARGFSKAASARPALRGVIFDMDGTLTKPNLDFKEMYQRCGVALQDDLLAAIRKMPAADAAAATDVIEEMESEGRRTLELFPGAVECSLWLHSHGVPMALVTRNSVTTVDHLQESLWAPAGLPKLEPAISRDDASIPAKPDPAAIQAIASRWGVPPGPELLMVGDSPANDVAFGKAAGVSTALVDSGRRFTEGGDDGGADLHVSNLALLPALLWRHFDVEASSGVIAGATKFEAPVPATAAAVAAVNDDADALLALDSGKLHAADASGNTPLVWAANVGAAKSVQALLSRGVDVNARGFLGATAVSRASRYGHTRVLSLLLSVADVDCDVPNDKLQYPLHFAAFKKQPEAVAQLLEHGANTLVLDRKGRTPAEDTSDELIRAAILAVRERHMAGAR